MLYQILFLVVGWILGLLSPVVAELFTKKRQLAELKRGLAVELGELRFGLATTSLAVAGSIGAWDREYLTWLKAVLDSYRGARDEDRRPLQTTVTGLLELDDQQLTAAGKAVGAPISPALRKHHLPYLESRLDYVATLGPDAQRQLLEIQAQVGVINELLDDIRFCLGKSFDSLPPSTRQAIDASLQNSYRAVLHSSRQAADLVGTLKLG
ncbi:MAG: hypothetical protein JOZ15_21255 [Acidobacteria bacterium]|nr:hypothetical protein [Acidobacteriota bacterium]